ncbi:MAG: tRNA (adenosine(37)-N6)-dimethylallyltransferase MiaA [Bacteroidia bacterium]
MSESAKFLILILGPTASGKTALSIELAKYFNTEILSTDSRQFYKGMDIGTAKPNKEELSAAPHHFIDFLNPEEYYSAGDYERDALQLCEKLFAKHPILIATGGSGLFVKALTEGLDDMPPADLNLRKELDENYQLNGIEYLQDRLFKINPKKYQEIDIQNPQRLMRAIEMSLQGVVLTSTKKQRPFTCIKIGLDWDRELLYNRINLRVDQMMQLGLEQEAKSFHHLQHLNSLQTVGYQELFEYFDGRCTLAHAIDKIKQHSRNYAKRQLTWFKKDNEIIWKKPSEIADIKQLIENKCINMKAQ